MKFNETFNTIKDNFKYTEAKFDHKEYPKRLRKKSEAELKYIIKDAKAAMKANPDSEKSQNGYYADEVNYAVMELNRRKKGGKQEVDEAKKPKWGAIHLAKEYSDKDELQKAFLAGFKACKKYDSMYESSNMNQEGYKYYVVVDDKIESGWYNRDDAKEHVAENLPDKQNGKVVAKVSLKKLNMDADVDSDWLGGEVLDND